MTARHIPKSIDIAITYVLPGIMSQRPPLPDADKVASAAANFLSGHLFRDTISGKDLERLLDSLSAFAKARRVELNDQELAVEQAHRDLARAAA